MVVVGCCESSTVIRVWVLAFRSENNQAKEFFIFLFEFLSAKVSACKCLSGTYCTQIHVMRTRVDCEVQRQALVKV